VLEPGVETAVPAPRDDRVRKPRIVSTAQVERSPPRPQPAPVPEPVSGVLPSTGSLSVDVVSWSKEASRRFVMINQAIYHEGDTVPGAGVLVRIDPESVVLRSGGQERVLRP
jgi:hypothetical protein